MQKARMETTAEVLDPVQPPAEPKVETTTAPAKADTSSLPAGKKDEFLDLVTSAKNPSELRAAAEKLRQKIERQPPVNPPIPKSEEETATPLATKAAEPETPAEETPAAAEEPAEAPAPEADAAEPDEDADEDTPITPISSKNAKIALPEDDKVGRLALSYKKRNRDWTMAQAMAAAESQLGVKPKTEPAAAEAPKSDLPQTIDAVDAAIEKLEAEKLKAADDLSVQEMAKIDNALRRLDRQRTKLERDGEVQQREQATAYETAFSASESKATALYEFASKPDSPAGKRMIEIEEALRDTEDPRYYSPNKPLLIAQMVAAEMNIAPKSKTAAPAKPAAPAGPVPPKKQVLPVGGSRTATTGAPAQSALHTEITGITTMAQLRSVQKKLGINT